MISRQICIDYFSCGEMHAVRLGPLQSARIIVLAVIFSLLAGTGFSIAGEGPATESTATAGPVPVAETVPMPVPWPGPVPWPETAPWPEPGPRMEPVPWANPVPWPGPVPWPEYAPWAVPPPPGYFATLGKTMDETHARIERGILKQTVRFDNFFGSVKPERLLQTRYDIRLRNSLRVEHGGKLTPGSNIRANFNLSRISERLRLFIAGEDEPGLTTQSLPQDPGNPGFDRTTPTT